MLKAIRWLAPFALVLLVGCQLSITEQELAGQSLRVAVFDSGMRIKDYNVSPQDPLHQQISDFIIKKSKGWSPNFVSYSPAVVIYGDGFNINYVGELAVYNGATGQLTRKIKYEDYRFLLSR